MGLDYSLQLSTDMDRAQPLGLLAENIQGLQSSEEDAFLCGTDIIVAAGELDEQSRCIMEEGFGFRPNLIVLFRFPSNHDSDKFAQTMLQGALLLLDHGRDGVLLFNGEIIVLQRLDGKLVFNADHHIWDDDYLKGRLTVPFEFRSLPSPFL